VLAGALCSIELVLEALATLAQTLERSGSSKLGSGEKITIIKNFYSIRGMKSHSLWDEPGVQVIVLSRPQDGLTGLIIN
jgi:hypothetical protein